MFATHRRKWILLSLAALGAAGMFFGPDGWHGLDIGPIGATVLYAAIWLFVIHLSIHSNDVFPAHASLSEKQSWVSLAFVLLITFHFLNLLDSLSDMGALADEISNPASRNFGMNLGMLIFAWIVVGGIVRAQNADTVELDERDLRIQRAAHRFSGGLMSMQIIGLIALLAIFPEQAQPWMRPLIVGNFLLGLLIVKTLVESIFLVARYARERQ
jgi:hypothetical protein